MGYILEVMVLVCGCVKFEDALDFFFEMVFVGGFGADLSIVIVIELLIILSGFGVNLFEEFEVEGIEFEIEVCHGLIVYIVEDV